MKPEFSVQIFTKSSYIVFHKKKNPHPAVAELFHAERRTHTQTDGRTHMTKLTVPFRSSANPPNTFHMLPKQCIHVFVRISEQTVIISPYSIKSLVLITGTECVYCAVWTLPLRVSLVFSLLTHMVTKFDWLQEHTTFLFLLSRLLFWTVK